MKKFLKLLQDLQLLCVVSDPLEPSVQKKLLFNYRRANGAHYAILSRNSYPDVSIVPAGGISRVFQEEFSISFAMLTPLTTFYSFVLSFAFPVEIPLGRSSFNLDKAPFGWTTGTNYPLLLKEVGS